MDHTARVAELSKSIWSWQQGTGSRRAVLSGVLALGASLIGGRSGVAFDHRPGHPSGPPQTAEGSVGWVLNRDTTVSLSSFDAVPVYRFMGFYRGPDTYTSNMYDSENHFYYADYVVPTTWRLGLVADRSLYVNMFNQMKTALGERTPHAALILDFTDVIDTGDPGDDDVVPPGPPPSPPEELEEYVWRIVAEAGDYDETITNARADTSPWLAQFDLPHQGFYQLSCTVRFTDRDDETTTRRYLLRDFLIVGIGDSYASGEGNPDVAGDADNFWRECSLTTLDIKLDVDIEMETEPIWLEPLAHRSFHSSHAQAASRQQRVYKLGDGTVVDERVTFLSFARSGAKVGAGLLGPQNGGDDFITLGQLDELYESTFGRPVDALLISIGGNDVGFAGGLNDLVTGDFPTVWTGSLGDDADARDSVLAAVEEALSEEDTNGDGLPDGVVAKGFRTLDRRIAELQSSGLVRDVYITTYPTTFFDTIDSNGVIGFESCDVFSSNFDLDITRRDYEVILEAGEKLNDAIRRYAEAYNWRLVDVAAEGALAGYGYCEEPTYWVGAERSCDWQGDFDGMMHPNIDGLKRIADVLAPSIAEATILARPYPEPAGRAATEVTIGAYDIYFDPKEVTIPANTDVTVNLPNNGVTLHNFSVTGHNNPDAPNLGIDVDLAVGTAETIAINAPAADYYFFCNVPGHEAAGMFGTLHIV